MGPVQKAMLERLAASPTGEAGFRKYETSASAIRRGWIKYVWESGYVTFYAITDAGRDALDSAMKRGGRP